jgi:hypothetical protein
LIDKRPYKATYFVKNQDNKKNNLHFS